MHLLRTGPTIVHPKCRQVAGRCADWQRNVQRWCYMLACVLQETCFMQAQELSQPGWLVVSRHGGHITCRCGMVVVLALWTLSI